MKVNSVLVSEMSGKLGGIVGLTTRFGMILRALVTPGNPASQAQFLVRGILSSLSSYFRDTLTEIKRVAWENLAEDTPGSASGLTLFVKGNSERLRGGVPLVEDAPSSAVCEFSQVPTEVGDSNPGATLQVDGTEFTLAFDLPAQAAMVDPWSTIDGGIMNVYLSRPQRASRNSRIKPFVYLGTLLGDTTSGSRPTSPQTFNLSPDAGPVSSEVQRAFASLNAGDVCYVKYTTTSADGRRSADFVARLVCGTV